MEGISQISKVTPVENLHPLAPRKRKAGYTKAGIASAISMAALAMFAPKIAEAGQVTVTVQGTVTSGSDNGVFGSATNLAGLPYTAVFTFDDTKGAQAHYSSGPYAGTPYEIYTSGGSSPGTAELTIEGATKPLGTTSNGVATFANTLGANWRTNYDRYINSTAVVAAGGVFTAATPVYAERADGQRLTFIPNGSGGFTSDTDTDYTLTLSGSTYTLKAPDDSVEVYTDLGTGEALLNTITQRNGYQLTLGYNGSNQLTSVTDSYSRALTLTYSGGFLNTVTTPGGLVLTYGYNASGLSGTANDRLATVSYNTSPVTSQTYLYETSTQAFALTGITDENGNRAATWAYDSAGRATSSERFANSMTPIEQTTISYNGTTGATVTNALGLQETYAYNVLQGVPKLSGISRAAIGPVSASSRAFTYDSNG